MFSINIEIIGAVLLAKPLSIKNTAPFPFVFCGGIPIVSIRFFELIKIGKHK